MAENKVHDLTISATVWRCYERSGAAHDGPFEFVGTATAEDADSAARRHCVEHWASGKHRILVVNSEEARSFVVSVEATEVGDE